MKIEKKLIAFSALAIIVGIASIAPLMVFMSAKAAPSTTDIPWFTVTTAYAYFGAGNGSLNLAFGSNATALNSAANEGNTQYAIHALIFNYTFNLDLKKEPNDRAEYYLVEATSDKGLFLNETFVLGTYGAAVDSLDFLKPENFHFNRSDWFDTSVVTSSGGALYSPHNITFTSNLYAQGEASQVNGDNGESYVYPLTPLSKAILGANTLTIIVRRLGWTTFTDNSTIVTQTNEVIAQIQL
jgi:hypothetical protein